LASLYGRLFMTTRAIKATRRKHINVLQHLVGNLKDRLTPKARPERDGVLADYHRGLAPLVVPVTLIKHYVTMYEIQYIQQQIYLNPHPRELMLRNYV
jgi:uncharacterized protein YbgA (DUF1722 family)